MTIGDRQFTRYIQHDTVQNVGDGEPLSAHLGQMLLVSNSNHLAHESSRHLASAVLPSTMMIPEVADSDGAWDAVGEIRPRSDGAYTDANAIPWDRRTAVKFGPVPLILDRESNARPVPRKVRFHFDVDLDAGSTSRRLFAAISGSSDPRSITSGRYYGLEAVNVSSGHSQVTLDVSPELEGGDSAYPAESWQTRTAATVGDREIWIREGWLWFGWLIVGGSANHVQAVNAYEIR